MPLVLFKEQPGENQPSVDEYFKPLLNGKTVMLRVQDPKLPKKLRIKNAPILLFAPVSIYGGPPGKLLVSLPAYGSEIIDVPGVRAIVFARLGLNMFLASALADVINRIFNGGSHGRSNKKDAPRSSRSGAKKRSRRRSA